jgi:hypothetical protein
MCRNIKMLHNFAPPATHDEAAFERAVERVTQVAHDLLHELITTAPPRSREEVARKAKERSIKRFAS